MAKLVLIVEDHPIVSESLIRIIAESDLNVQCLHKPCFKWKITLTWQRGQGSDEREFSVK